MKLCHSEKKLPTKIVMTVSTDGSAPPMAVDVQTGVEEGKMSACQALRAATLKNICR